MGQEVREFWQSAQAFRTAQDDEGKHEARVKLIRLALENNNKVGERAASILRVEGLAVIRDTHIRTRAI